MNDENIETVFDWLTKQGDGGLFCEGFSNPAGSRIWAGL